mmetsp:Transcript_2343/g.3486  ORF Transcript_2343/g.3486 Transcript_2343/m.3486 type:complete len:305 (-) Transcript_2343:190-1104(-)
MISTKNLSFIAFLLSASCSGTGAFVLPKSSQSSSYVLAFRPIPSTSESTTQLHVASTSTNFKKNTDDAKYNTKSSRSSRSANKEESSALSSTAAYADVSSDVSPSALEKFSASYQTLTTNHYLPMAFLQAGILASSADMMTQTLEGSTLASMNYAHVFAMASIASSMSGAMNAIWLKQLEAAFPGKAAKEVFAKTMIHAVILASIINSAYLVGVPYLTDHVYLTLDSFSPAALTGNWNMDEFITLTKLEICMFIPYNTLAFKFVPPSVRPLTHAAVSATFNVAVSAVTLGYFDKWVANAMGIFS